MNNSGNVSTIFTLITFIIVASLLSFVLSKALAADPDMRRPSTEAGKTVPPTTSPSTQPLKLDFDDLGRCQKKIEKSPPTVAEQCRTASGVYMSLDSDGRLVFKSLPRFLEPVTSDEGTRELSIQSVVQQSFETARKDFERGLFYGYQHGFRDGIDGNPYAPTEFQTIRQAENDGFKQGYKDGHAIGTMERNFQHLPPPR